MAVNANELRSVSLKIKLGFLQIQYLERSALIWVEIFSEIFLTYFHKLFAWWTI